MHTRGPAEGANATTLSQCDIDRDTSHDFQARAANQQDVAMGYKRNMQVHSVVSGAFSVCVRTAFDSGWLKARVCGGPTNRFGDDVAEHMAGF